MGLAFNNSIAVLRKKYRLFTPNSWDPRRTQHVRTNSWKRSRISLPLMQHSGIETSVAKTFEEGPQRSLFPTPSFGFDNGDLKTATDGEWFGFEATFSSHGTLLPIPDRYVPDEFRDWGVAPNGFDTVSSSRVTEGALYLKRTRALPSVGCEADAVIPEVSVVKLEGPGNGGFSDGCISCGSVELGKSALYTILANGKQRVQLSFRLTENFGDVTVFNESWGGEFCDGQVLPGCGGGDRFAEGPKLEVASLYGSWEYEAEEVIFPEDSSIRQTSGVLSRDCVEGELITLPKGISVRLLREGSSVLIEAGWLCDDTRIVVERHYKDGDLIKIKRSIERRMEA
ncbi:hypothetical protein FGB62_30g345 [Gracilaria domingensis]|nr:hypothetical protein FGB62_30g345 [Gracilaria domingensis]